MSEVHVTITDEEGNNLGGWTTREDGEHVPDISAAPTEPLTLDEFSAANATRAARWHPGFPDDDTWNLADWSNAMCGEAGEAANIVKKIRRYEDGLRGESDPTLDELREMLAEELADIITYADLLATKADIDLPWALVLKFNSVSRRQGFPDRLRDPR